MASKVSNIFFPTLTSFVVLAGLLKIEDKYHNYFYTIDPNFDTGPQVDIPLVFVLAIPFAIALIFQALAVLPFWEKIKNKKQLNGLNLWQIIILFSLSIGLVFALVGLYKDGFIIEVFTSSVILSSIFSIYWITNFLTLTFIDKRKYSR